MTLSFAMLALIMVLDPDQAPNDSRPAPKRAGLSWSAADAVARKVDAIEAEARGSRPVRAREMTVTEPELNSYLNLTLAPRMPPELSDLVIRLELAHVAATGLVDLDRVRAKLPPQSPWSPLNFLHGLVSADARVEIPNHDATATLVVNEFHLGGVSIPVSLLQQVVLSATKTRESPTGFDILAPFRLPYSAKQIRLEAGLARLEF